MNQVLVAPEVYDRLRQVMASDPDGFCELYRDYLADARQTLEGLRSACEGQKSDELSAKAHYLKGSSLILGIRPVAQACAEMGEVGRASDFRAAAEKLAETAELLSSVGAELERRLGPRVIPQPPRSPVYANGQRESNSASYRR